MVKNNDIERILLMGIGRSGLDNETSIIAKALSELMDYRAIGTVEELQSMKEKNDTLRALYEDARKEGSHLIAKEKAAAVDEFLHNAETKICDRILQNQARLDFASGLSVANRIIDEIAEQMKAGAENE